MKYQPILNKIILSTLCAWMSTSVSAGVYDQVVIFGDSLSDGGSFNGLRYTTNPGKTAAEYVADVLGLTTTPSDTGGSNFAQGGQTVNGTPYATPPGEPIRPISTQVTEYLMSNGGVANPNALYLIQGGANDIFKNLDAVGAGTMTQAQLQTATYQSGVDFATQVAILAATGAKYIVVSNVPNIGIAPAFAGSPYAGVATAVTKGYNDVVAGAVTQLGLNIVALDSYNLLGEIVANPSAYGFSNATGVACTSGSSIMCSPATLVTPDAASTYVFADSVHPTTAGQKLLAQYMSATLNAPTQISLLSSAPLSGGQRRADSVWTQALNGLKTGQQTWHTFADVGHSKTDFDGADYTSNYLLMGADRRIGTTGNNRIGASIGYQQYKGDFGTHAGTFKMSEPTIGVHFSHAIGDVGAALVQASYGRLHASDINRQITLGAATRTESGNTKGSHTSISAQGQITAGSFAKGKFTHGPMGRIAYEKVSLNGFSEAGTQSTAMTFGKQTREGVLASIGYQLQANYGKVQPYAQVSYEIDDTRGSDVSAHLNTAYSSFSTPALQGDNGTRVRLGANIALSKSLNMHVGAQRTFGKNSAEETAFNLGIDAEF